ncbi:AP endonuclease [Microthyrium microscopicum]|uniref:Apurinic-apyrimidinic endonuclease 1 n=1 Tax=Microthyrium microscopicum TaxID=703497 RepID=A0A6A6UFR8_9PEZI|nr:AP endonuclease [Microthyrium microscopicum]
MAPKSKAGTKRSARVDISPPAVKRKRANEEPTYREESGFEEKEKKAKTPAKRQSKKVKVEDLMPLAVRTIGSKILVGAHISGAGAGVHNAIVNSVHIGGNAFSLFMKSQRKWAFAPLSNEVEVSFASACKEHQYGAPHHEIPPIVPHGSYLVNLAHTEASRAKQAYDHFLDDLSRCHKLGIRLYNFHPGNAVGAESRSEAISHIAKQLNKAHNDESSGKVITLLETMAAFGGNTIGTTFEELAEIIEQIDDKNRVGVCLDTCHIFAAGYDLRTPESYKDTMDRFESTIGLRYLKAFHINDSKAPLNSGRDLHANIGTGFLGLKSFWNVVNDTRLWGLPLILETPIDRKNKDGKNEEDKSVWAGEIKLLESLVGMDPEGAEFEKLSTELQSQGKAERERVQAQVDKRKPKGKKKKKNASTDEESE